MAKVKNRNKDSISVNQEITKRKQLMFSVIVLCLLGLSAYYFATYEPPQMASSFYENRQSVESYRQSRALDSAKVKAERNIFLQD